MAVGVGLLATAMSLFDPAPAIAADIGAGQKVFVNNCAVCHSGGRTLISTEKEKSITKEALKEYLTDGFSEASIVT